MSWNHNAFVQRIQVSARRQVYWLHQLAMRLLSSVSMQGPSYHNDTDRRTGSSHVPKIDAYDILQTNTYLKSSTMWLMFC